ncbi:hypothetical protein OSTOST_11442 [Ostertagia ostertagi]
MLIRGVTMDGARIGIDYYLLRPDMSKVFRLKTWLEAAKQLCFSLGIGFGCASPRCLPSNCKKEPITVFVVPPLLNILVSNLGFVVPQI